MRRSQGTIRLFLNGEEKTFRPGFRNGKAPRRKIKPPNDPPMTDDDKAAIIVLAGIATVMSGILIWLWSLL